MIQAIHILVCDKCKNESDPVGVAMDHCYQDQLLRHTLTEGWSIVDALDEDECPIELHYCRFCTVDKEEEDNEQHTTVS